MELGSTSPNFQLKHRNLANPRRVWYEEASIFPWGREALFPFFPKKLPRTRLIAMIQYFSVFTIERISPLVNWPVLKLNCV